VYRTGQLLTAAEPELPEADPELLLYFEREHAQIIREVEECRVRAKALKEELEALWENEKSAAYELSSVFIHRGTSPSWGHYFFYSRDLRNNPDSWFKYNDSEVSVVSKDEILADGTESTANPYLVGIHHF
jgi:ubiquitin carboxyl-terminal hydrolase 25